jgi:hypothetical protein
VFEPFDFRQLYRKVSEIVDRHLSPASRRKQSQRWTELDLRDIYHEGGERQFDRGSWPDSIKKSFTIAHDGNRAVIRENIAMREEIRRLQGKVGWYRVKNIALTSIITALAYEGLKAIAPMIARWLGLI